MSGLVEALNHTWLLQVATVAAYVCHRLVSASLLHRRGLSGELTHRIGELFGSLKLPQQPKDRFASDLPPAE